jgi:hypothetical protein
VSARQSVAAFVQLIERTRGQLQAEGLARAPLASWSAFSPAAGLDGPPLLLDNGLTTMTKRAAPSEPPLAGRCRTK